MTDAVSEDVSGSLSRELRLATIVSLGLLAVESLIILGFVAGGIANQVAYGNQFFGDGALHTWGYTLTLVSAWSAPQAVVVFLLGPLALVAWVHRRGDDAVSESRTAVVLNLELALALLTVVGGILSVVGRVLLTSPSESWSGFFETLGSGLGSVVLGGLGVVVVKWLSDDLGFVWPGRRHADAEGGA